MIAYLAFSYLALKSDTSSRRPSIVDLDDQESVLGHFLSSEIDPQCPAICHHLDVRATVDAYNSGVGRRRGGGGGG